LSTTTYVTIAALGIFALFALWSPTGTIWWQAHGPALAIPVSLYATSWLLLGKSMADAGLALQTGSLRWIALLRDVDPGPTGRRRHVHGMVSVAAKAAVNASSIVYVYR
jgi:methanethiol S-methyltransferase